MERLLYRIGPTMGSALTLLRDADRAGRTYASVLALARDVAPACGISWQAAHRSATRLLEFGLVERRDGALRLTAAGWAAAQRPGVPRPAPTRA